MRCPECGSEDDRVVKTIDYEVRVWRRRECNECKERWSTNERRVESREVEE